MIIIPDIAETFPTCPSFGFTVEPEYMVKITSREGGFERRDLKWSKPLAKYTGVPMGDRAMDDILDVYEFWQAMRGMWSGFRFRDLLDYQSCRPSVIPTANDQPLESSPSGFRLVKNYVTKSGRTTQSRYITRPIASTLLVANNVGAAQTDFTVNEATGVITPGGTFAGTPGFWGGQFDVYVRFAAQFNPALSFNSGNVSIQLDEIRQALA